MFLVNSSMCHSDHIQNHTLDEMKGVKKQVLLWIGFDTGQRPVVQLDMGNDLLDLNTIQENDISDFADSFAKHTAADG